MISVDGLSVLFGGFTLFDNVSFVLNKRDRVALVGKNGAGKSTMLKIFAGKQEPTNGNVAYPKDVTIGYLPQHMTLADGNTVFEEAALAFSHIHKMEEKLNGINQQLAERTDYESEEYTQLIEQSTHLNDVLLMSGVNNFEAEVEKTLSGLGFNREDFTRQTSEFSGGWRMRIELAKLLLQRPDVLLLDEPTNHLDIESIQWLETFLSRSPNAVMLVSHDKAFLDSVTDRTIEISLGKTYDYKVNYSKYVVLREEYREQQMRAYENQQKQIQKTEDFIERFRYKATKAVQVQSRIKQLDKIDLIEVDEVDTAFLNLKFPPAPRSGSYPVITENLEKSYGDKLIFSGATFTIERGEKIAFVGKNGEGKSTLVKCIMDEIDYKGKLVLGHNVKIGYFAQNQAQLLNENKTVFETIDDIATGDIRTKVKSILGAFMFGGDDSEKKVKVLSGGERSRLAMIKLLLEPVNLLILDEPTNHLDMQSKDILKEALKEFDGTVIVVSHDRDFLNGLVDKVYEFGNKQVKEHLGGIQEFLERKKMQNLQELEVATKIKKENSEKEDAPSDNKISYEERKEINKQIRKVEKQIEDIEATIHRLETEIETLEAELATPAGAAKVSLFEKHGSLNKELETAMQNWENLNTEHEELTLKIDN